MLKLAAIASVIAGALAAATCPVADVSAVAHTGTPVGAVETHDGVSMYISKPKNCKGGPVNGVLYLTDVFGIQLNENKLLADSFARAGYHVVAPDLFNGDPAHGDINVPGFNTSAFLAAHGPNVTDPIVTKAVAYMRGELGIKKIGVTGYCFGGRYAFRSVGDGQVGTAGGDVAFAAHPSLLTDAEISGVKGPSSVAAADTDNMMNPERRAQFQTLLKASNQTWSLAVYSGTSHGFAVRGNVADPRIKFGKESAFFQAVRWFDAWL